MKLSITLDGQAGSLPVSRFFRRSAAQIDSADKMGKMATIYQMSHRKCWHHDNLPPGWKEVAWERFDYVECGIYEKNDNLLTPEDSKLIERYGEVPDDWIEPTRMK